MMLQRIISAVVVLLSLSHQVHAQNLVEAEFSYGYKLLANVTPQQPDVGAALVVVRDALLLSLNQVIEKAGVDIEIQFLASKETGPCDESSLSKIGDFDLCTRAESQVNLLIPDTVDPLLVERVAIADIQTFVAEFNSESENIQILFEYPLSVSAVVKVSLIGVDGTMGTGEKLALEKTLRDIFGPILQANDPAFSIDTLQVLLQEAENVRRRSLRRALQNDNGQQVPVNNVDLYLRATCSGGDCTNQFFETALLLEMGAITEALEIALRAAGREQGTDYFESLTRVQVADSGLGEVLPAPFTDEYQETEDSKIPAWVWVVLALDFVIIVVALGWVMMRLRRRENEEAASKYDNYQAPDEASGFPEYTEDERQSLPAGQASFGSDDSD